MAEPVSTAAAAGASPLGILGSLAWAVLQFLPFLMFAVMIGLAIFVFMWLRSSGERDQMKEMYLEMVNEAKNAPPPHLKRLYRLDLPRMNDILEAKAAGGITEQQLMDLKESLRNTTPGIFYGDIVGFNTFDLMATVNDLYLKDKLEDKEKESAEKLLTGVGGKLHLVVYKKRGGWLRTEEQGIFCFDDQLMGLGSSDGIVTFLGSGTQRHAVYFQTPSGYPERAQVMQTHLVSGSRVRTAMLLESNIIEFVLNAVNFDTTALKTIELYASREAISAPKEEHTK